MIIYCILTLSEKGVDYTQYDFYFYSDVERALKVHDIQHGYHDKDLVLIDNGRTKKWNDIPYFLSNRKSKIEMLYDYDKVKKIGETEIIDTFDYLLYQSLKQNPVRQEIRNRKLNRILKYENEI